VIKASNSCSFQSWQNDPEFRVHHTSSCSGLSNGRMPQLHPATWFQLLSRLLSSSASFLHPFAVKVSPFSHSCPLNRVFYAYCPTLCPSDAFKCSCTEPELPISSLLSDCRSERRLVLARPLRASAKFLFALVPDTSQVHHPAYPPGISSSEVYP
jgi:hypothetical protein